MADLGDFASDFERDIGVLNDDLLERTDRLLEDIGPLLEDGTIDQAVIESDTAFREIIEDFDEQLDALAIAIVADLASRGIETAAVGAPLLDAIEDLRQGFIDQIVSSERAFNTSVQSYFDRANFPGFRSRAAITEDLRRITDGMVRESVRNGVMFSRIFRETAAGSIVSKRDGTIGKSVKSRNWVYGYAGPADHRNREHCAFFVGKTATRAEVDSISPQQLYLAGDDPSAPLFNPFASATSPCRHQWILISKGEKK